jgi:ABC-type sugar transport system permease subunit
MAGTLTEYGKGFWLRLIALMMLDALALYSLFILIEERSTFMLIGLIVGTLFINWVYLWPRTQALRWITPGLVLMSIFVVVPIIFTFWVSLTNWQTGNVNNKDQTIEFFESQVYIDPDSEGELFDLYVYSDDAGENRLLLVNENGEYLFGEPRLRSDPPVDNAVEATGTFAPGDEVPPPTFEGFRLLEKREVFALSAQIDFASLVIDVPQGEVVILGLSQGRVVLASQRWVYDEPTDVMYDTVLDRACTTGTATATKGNFVCDDGEVLDPGWVAFIGTKNYTRVLTNPLIRGPFLRVFLWNVVFAAFSVGMTFALGIILALSLHHIRMKGVRIYRSVYIIPYAIPAFLSILVWRGLFNSTFGTVNRLLAPLYDLLGVDPIRWLTDPTWAKVTVLLVNLWLGFPYMFLLATGALQSIPEDVLEAARTDGARGSRVFRSITFPLTNGGPPVLGAEVPVGHTDILISFTFKLASQGGRGNQFGLASAITILIFLMLLAFSAFSFRMTKRLEDTHG